MLDRIDEAVNKVKWKSFEKRMLRTMTPSPPVRVEYHYNPYAVTLTSVDIADIATRDLSTDWCWDVTSSVVDPVYTIGPMYAFTPAYAACNTEDGVRDPFFGETGRLM